MVLFNPSFSHNEGQYYINQDRSFGRVVADVMLDVMTAWMTESSMKLWVRIWLFFLMTGCLLPLAFLPHPFAITNLVGVLVILPLNGRELARVRGINKNMGWPHVLGWAPVMIVNILCLTTDSIGSDGQLTWENAGDDAYEKARYVAIVYNTVILGISILFDAADTIFYYGFGKTNIERSRWTTDQLELNDKDVDNTEH